MNSPTMNRDEEAYQLYIPSGTNTNQRGEAESRSRMICIINTCIMGVLTSFVKNGEIRPSVSCKIILAQKEERNQLNS